MILQRRRRTENRHDAVTGELVHCAAVLRYHRGGMLDQLAHDLAQPLRTHRRRDVHRMNNIGEQHRYLLVLRQSSGVCERCTALVTELGVGWQFGATRPTEDPRCGQATATLPAGVHVSIVSLLVSDVRHIAVPYSIRSFETLV